MCWAPAPRSGTTPPSWPHRFWRSCRRRVPAPISLPPRRSCIARPSTPGKRPARVNPIVNALSIDVEEYYHATVFQEAVNGVTTGLPSRVEASTERVLELLGTAGVKGTFFVLGEGGPEHP